MSTHVSFRQPKKESCLKSENITGRFIFLHKTVFTKPDPPVSHPEIRFPKFVSVCEKSVTKVQFEPHWDIENVSPQHFVMASKLALFIVYGFLANWYEFRKTMFGVGHLKVDQV